MTHAAARGVAGMALDRANPITLVDQIARHIEMAILEGALQPGGRLPSRRDLAAQLGVAQGTVKGAYEKLTDRGWLVAAAATGTRVVDPLPLLTACSGSATFDPDETRLPDFRPPAKQPLPFQMGVPAQDAFPATLWARLHRRAVQATASRTGSSDPRGLSELRSALASHVALARGIECSPEQIIVTTGSRGGLSIALRAVDPAGRQAWVEDPGYPVGRLALELAGVNLVAVPVDDQGIDVEQGRALAPHAALAYVTPVQHAPTGVTLSESRRRALLDWAEAAGAWIIEDDYLAELHLSGRSANALASGRGADRVIHVGTFSKTIAPMLGLGFIVAPLPLARRLIDVATWLGSPPSVAAQRALADFLREGHYLRHLRRMRQLYAQRSRSLLDTLAGLGSKRSVQAGLAVLVDLPDGFDDAALSLRARAVDLCPHPLSTWYASASRSRSGLILGVANLSERSLEEDCRQLLALITEATIRSAPCPSG